MPFRSKQSRRKMRGGALSDILQSESMVKYNKLWQEGLAIKEEMSYINSIIRATQNEIGRNGEKSIYGIKRFFGLSKKAERDKKWAKELENAKAELLEFRNKMDTINTQLNELVKLLVNDYAKEFSKYGYTPNEKSEFVFSDKAREVTIPVSLTEKPATPVTNSYSEPLGRIVQPTYSNSILIEKEKEKPYIPKTIVFANSFKNYDDALQALEAANPAIANSTQVPAELPQQGGQRRGRSRTKRTRRAR